MDAGGKSFAAINEYELIYIWKINATITKVENEF